MTMEITEVIFVALGLMVSVVAFFLKKESNRVDRLSKQIRDIEIDLAQNDARDVERWRETQKLLEDRRLDSIKIFEKLEKK
jgi:cell division protein FtsB